MVEFGFLNNLIQLLGGELVSLELLEKVAINP